MTEDEAREKACCGPRGSAYGHGWATHSNCIGSACMAWRVAVIEAHQENRYNTAERPEGDGWEPFSTSSANRAWSRTLPERHVGYCGLAGSPQ